MAQVFRGMLQTGRPGMLFKRNVFRTLCMQNSFMNSLVCVFEGVLPYKMGSHNLRRLSMECFKVVFEGCCLREMFSAHHAYKTPL